ncbi:unnamed protein product [Zymoseptoria tritici ST99CH_3D7]|uniref:Uncharacterized protein n=1 Tax=Zymoseptoria tritici (strain ST99CH_3D7) TaxID=1276538 RepID=A0A1X7SA07_ZYMT9|nr:unnamed protein product [Zymoseptoria tritici ST99CH_3D7]
MSRSPSTEDDLDTQRVLVSRYYALLDTETLLTDQRDDTARRTIRLVQRKAALLYTRRMRPEYISDNVLRETARVLNLKAKEKGLEERDRRTREMLCEVRDDMGRFRKDESTGYWRLDHYPEGRWNARDRSMALGVLAVFLFGLAWV